MYAVHEKSYSDSLSLDSESGAKYPKPINIVDSLKKVMSISARSSNEHESELENVAVLAYD